jgi:molybdopterin converting factor small subunit
MQVRMRYLAQLKHAAGGGVETLDVAAPCAIADLLRRLAEKHGDAFRRIVFDAHGHVQPALLIFLGDEQVSPDTVQSFGEGAEITVLAPMAGG